MIIPDRACLSCNGNIFVKIEDNGVMCECLIDGPDVITRLAIECNFRFLT